MATHTDKKDVLRAGFGRRDITPQEPSFLVGYPNAERTSTGTHDPLLASALCLECGGETLVFLALDLCFVSAEWTRDCRGRIHAVTGIPAHNIVITATHTHSGPVTVDILAWRHDPFVPPCDPDYLEFSCQETAAAAIAAWRALEPAEIAATTADVGGLAGGNRIDADGPEDPEAGLWLVRRAGGGAPISILSVYGMHPTVLHEDSKLFSADFIAFTRSHLEEQFPGAGVVYLNGVCGNQSPRRVVRGQTFAEAERLGVALGQRMAESLRGLGGFADTLPLAARIERIQLEGKTFPSVAEAEENFRAAMERYESLRSANAGHAAVRTAECTTFGAEEVLTLAKAETSGEVEAIRQKYREQEIQAFRLGDAFLVAWPGEFFVEYGLEVKSRAPRKTFLTTIANGELHGYIVTPEAEQLGGYEAQMGLFPAREGRKFVEGTLALLVRMETAADQ